MDSTLILTILGLAGVGYYLYFRGVNRLLQPDRRDQELSTKEEVLKKELNEQKEEMGKIVQTEQERSKDTQKVEDYWNKK